MTGRPIVFVDTETNTLGHLARPWEIALVRRDTDGEHELLWQVEDPLPAGTDPEALLINGYYFRHGVIDVEAGQELGPEWLVANRVHEQLRDVVLIGVGVHFDAAVLSAMFRRHGLPEQPWHYAIVDLKAATWGDAQAAHQSGVHVASSVRQLPMQSEQLAAWIGARPPADDERHTALGDVRWAARWYDALTGGGAA